MRKIAVIIVEKPDRILLNQGIIVNTTNNKTYQERLSGIMNKEGYNFRSMVFSPKKEKPKFNHINPN